MKTIIANEGEWIFTADRPIGEWDFYKKVSCPDWVDTDAKYAIIGDEEKEEKERLQDEYIGSM